MMALPAPQPVFTTHSNPIPFSGAAANHAQQGGALAAAGYGGGSKLEKRSNSVPSRNQTAPPPNPATGNKLRITPTEYGS